MTPAIAERRPSLGRVADAGGMRAVADELRRGRGPAGKGDSYAREHAGEIVACAGPRTRRPAALVRAGSGGRSGVAESGRAPIMRVARPATRYGRSTRCPRVPGTSPR